MGVELLDHEFGDCLGGFVLVVFDAGDRVVCVRREARGQVVQQALAAAESQQAEEMPPQGGADAVAVEGAVRFPRVSVGGDDGVHIGQPQGGGVLSAPGFHRQRRRD